MDGRDGGIAVEVVVVGAHLDDVGIHRLLTIAESVVGICSEFGEKRREVLRGGNGEVGCARTSVAKQSRTADVDAVDALRIEGVALVFRMTGTDAQCEKLHGQLPFPVARNIPSVRLANNARRGAHRAVIDLHGLRQQCHHVADASDISR